MHARRQPDSSYVFPSPQRGEKDLPVRTFKQAFYKARDEAKLPHLGFHDFRHLFVSKLVMAGVDYMTIAQWAGHQDGGILIGKVYGHLNDAHKVATAQRLTLFERPANVTEMPKQAAG
jgi:integrase